MAPDDEDAPEPPTPHPLAALAADDRARLRAFFERRGVDAHAAEDCVQDLFVRLLRARPGRPPRRGFLEVVARSVLVDWFRRARVRGVADEPRAEHAVAEPRHELRLDLQAAIARLPDGQREVVVLALVEGRRYAEVAARLGIPEGTVKSRMYHAVRALRAGLGHE